MDKINNIGLARELLKVYDFDGFTPQEVWSRVAQKINIIIEHFNYLYKKFDNQKELVDSKLNYLLNEGLTEQVSKKIIALVNDGTIGELINGTLLKEINDKVDTFKNEINEQLDNIENNVELNYAKKDDVAKLSSGTPLFASSTAEMIDTTRNYVNTTDGYLYSYSGGQWIKTTVLYQATGVQTTVKSYSLNSKVEEVKDNKYIQEIGNIVAYLNSTYLKFDCSNLTKVIYGRNKAFVQGEGIGIYDSNLQKIGYVSSFNLIKTEGEYYYYLIDLTNYSNAKYILTTRRYGDIWQINYNFYDYYKFYKDGIIKVSEKIIIDEEVREKLYNIEKSLPSLVNNHILKDKKWTIISDSLSDETNVLPNRKYPTMIKELTGVNIQNLAHAGWGWKNGNNYFVEIAKSVATDSDILTFMGSINDKNYTLGTATDKTTDTIGGCINVAIDNAYNKNLGIKIGLISPIPSGASNIPSNTDCFLHKLSVLMEEIAKLRGIPFLDLFHSSNIRTNNTSFVTKYMLDDTHLNELGQEKFMVNRILSFITSI